MKINYVPGIQHTIREGPVLQFINALIQFAHYLDICLQERCLHIIQNQLQIHFTLDHVKCLYDIL